MQRCGFCERLRKNCHGFSLLELMVVLMIMALAVSFVGPRFKSRDKVEFKVAVRKVVAVLRYARRMALISGWPREVTIALLKRDNDDKTTGVRIAWLEQAVSPAGGEDGVQSGSGRFKDVTDRVLLFFPDGSVSGGKLVVTGGGRRRIISVNPVTGKVEVE